VNQLVVSGTNVTIGTSRTNNLLIESNTVFDTDTTVTFNNMTGDYLLLNGGGSGDGLSIQGSDVNTTVTLASRSQVFYGDAGLFISDGATKKGIVFANSGQFNFLEGTLTTNAQPNITSVGTLTSLAVTGNANVGNLNATTAVIASTLTSNVATGTAPLTVTSTTRVANLNVAQANVADFIGVAAGTGNNFLIFANAATGNVSEVTSTGLTANLSANSITATTFIGALANGNSNVNIATANGNVTIAAVGNTTMTVTGTGANITGTLSATGNITGSYLISAHASGDEGGEISLAQPPNGNLSGGITIDAYQNTLRMFEQGGTARGLSIDIANSPAGGGTAIGYRDIPQVAAGNVTLAATDAGKHYYSTTAGNLTLTIPLNSSVPFTTGTAISIVVQAAGNVLVNAASGVTLYMAGNSTAANRVVGGYGMATLLKVASDTWFINGTGVA
jgi:hypothetical protein